MSKLSVFVLLCHGLFLMKNILGTEVKLECPTGYISNAVKIYKSLKSWNSGTSMMCARCSLKINPNNSFEVCEDVNGFTDPDTSGFKYHEYISHFKTSSYPFMSNHYLTTYECRSGFCADGHQSCSVTAFQNELSKRFKTPMHCKAVCLPCDDSVSSAMPAHVCYSIFSV